MPPAKKKKKAVKRRRKAAPEISASRPFRRVGAIVPKGIIRHFGNKLNHAGIREDPRVWVGKMMLLSFSTGAVPLLLYAVIYNPPTTEETLQIASALFFGGMFGVAILIYTRLYLHIADRANTLEKALPDFLLLTVSNLRAGMTPYWAFVSASRPEFGALHEEVKLATARVSGTASIADVLGEMANYFDSRVFHRTSNLFTKGMRSGGRLADLLRMSADEVRKLQDLRSELITRTRTYTIFLAFIVAIVMPFLLAVSTQFVTIFVNLQTESPDFETTGAGAGLPTFAGKITITTDEMVTFSVVALLVTGVLVAALAGIISRGRALYGVKYFPFYAVASMAFFLLARFVLGSMLATFAG